jgi:hypothetical protein
MELTMIRRTIALLAAAGAARAALADGTATWLWEVTTQDGDRLVEPGETATVTLSLLMESFDFEHAIIAAAIFDTLGDDGAANGHIADWEVLNGLDGLTGDLTTTDGVSLFNTNAGQLSIEVFTTDNPVAVLTFQWQPLVSADFDVGYTTHSELFDLPHTVVVWEYDEHAHEAEEAVVYPVVEAAITFSNVGCEADFHTDGVLDILDFIAFQSAWNGADPLADCNADGLFDILDFVCYQELFVRGCP